MLPGEVEELFNQKTGGVSIRTHHELIKLNQASYQSIAWCSREGSFVEGFLYRINARVVDV